MEKRKRIEQEWYDVAAARRGDGAAAQSGAATVPVEIRAPYEAFEREVLRRAKPGTVVVDVGAGTGVFSLTARGEGRLLVASDISHGALRIAQQRAAMAGVPLCVVCADAERLPFRDASVNLVTTAGVLYCLDLGAVAAEIRRVLSRDGSWVIVDSLNDSPLYRLNRLVGFVRRRRTALAVRNVPSSAALDSLRSGFRTFAIAYHGVLAFLLPLLKPALGARRAGAFVSAADRRLGWLQKWAFKVVVVAQHPR